MNARVINVKDFQKLDILETDLVDSWREVSRSTHRFLMLLREFDLRRGWKTYGNNDCAEWLDWRCGISRSTAQEKVRVARALWDLPQIEEAFRRGDVSYSKVRALTRVATEKNETDLLDYALQVSAAQLESYCRRLRNGDAEASALDARRLHEGRSLVRHLREDGSGTLSVELPQADLELVLKALELVGSRLPDDPARSLFAKAADALVQMAQEALAGNSPKAATDGYQVVVHVDAAALDGRGGESDLPLPTVQRLTCDGAIVPLITGKDGGPLNVGRKQRAPTTAIRRALIARDGRCQWPGCHCGKFLEAHHVHHWALGGETRLSNLLTLCSIHHKLVHEGGFSIRRHPDGSVYFVRPDGRPVEAPLVPDEWGVEERGTVYRICSPSAEDDARSPSAEDSAGRFQTASGRWSLATLGNCTFTR